MLKRKIYDKLLSWKNTKDKKCLLIKGARQVGKTFIVEQFGRTEYKNYVYLNFYVQPAWKTIFAAGLNAEEIFRRIMTLEPSYHIEAGATLLFMDEIQECAEARAAIKFLILDGRADVVASGSMLGINYKKVTSIPVGYEEQVDMYALDFEEFLWAMGRKEELVSYLKEYFVQREEVPTAINELYSSLLRQYMAVGGMPEAVNIYLKTHNLGDVNRIQTNILRDYYDDIRKYATIPERQKIADCYRSLTVQLAKEYTKFQYKDVKKGARASTYANSINWLEDAGLVCKCHNMTVPEFPMLAYIKLDQFKLYATDIGLLTAMYGLNLQLAIVRNEFKGTVKGGIYENLIFDMLNKRGIKVQYYRNENNTQEIEFFKEEDNQVVAIEVKSKKGATVSLNRYIEEYKPQIVYKLSDGNVGMEGVKVTMPHYMAMFL